MNYKFELTGETPLLMHQDSVETSDILMESRKEDKKAKRESRPGDDRFPAWTWQGYLYSDGASIVMPATNVMTCIRQGAARKILEKSRTYKEASQSGMLIITEFCEFVVNGKVVSMEPILAMRGKSFADQSRLVEKLGFQLFVKRAAIQRAKHVRVRPRFNEWAVRGEIRVLDEQIITAPVLRDLLDLAGRVGIGDWRPGCKTPGPYGMFKAKVK